MYRLSLIHYIALLVFAPLAMSACDFPMPAAGDSAATQSEPVWASGATRLSGELTDDDAVRDSGQKEDRVATVAVPAGHTLQVLMESPTFDTYLNVILEGNDRTFANDDFNGSTRRSYLSLPNTSGSDVRAIISASAYTSNARGAYSIQYQIIAPPPTPTGSEISIPGQYSGSITGSTPEVPLTSNDAPRRAEAYTFSLAQGQRATVRMESPAFDTYLKVLRNGTFAMRNDDYQGNRSVSQVELTSPGSYVVLAGAFSSSGTGDFVLTVSTGDDSPQAPAEETRTSPLSLPPLGGGGPRTVQGTLSDDDSEAPLTLADDLRKADAYEVPIRAGQTLVVEMESEAFDTYLKVLEGTQSVARNDDAGSTRRSALRYTSPTNARLTILAGTFTASGRGAYTLNWRIE